MLRSISSLVKYCTVAEGARAALNLSGTVLGYYPVRVLPSKTAIAPVNPTFLPRVSGTSGSTYSVLSFVVHVYLDECTECSKSASFFVVVCSLMMSVRCVQGLFIAQTLTRRFASLPLYSVFPLCISVSILFDALGAGLSG
jgi:hypothetical protein